MAEYSNTSPYKNTPQNSITMGIWEPRFFPAQEDDIYYEIDSWYDKRPDLLSADLYGTPKLWWCFAQRNPDVLIDPVFGFEAGKRIYLPKMTTLLFKKLPYFTARHILPVQECLLKHYNL